MGKKEVHKCIPQSSNLVKSYIQQRKQIEK